MKRIDIPGVGLVDFPDSMTDAEISSAIETDILKTAAQPEAVKEESGNLIKDAASYIGKNALKLPAAIADQLRNKSVVDGMDGKEVTANPRAQQSLNKVLAENQKTETLKPGAKIVDGLPGIAEVGFNRGYAGLGRVEAGLIKAAADLTGSESLGKLAESQNRYADEIEGRAVLRGTPVEGFAKESIVQDLPEAGANAISSVMQTAPSLVVGAATGGSGLPAMFGSVALQEYNEGRNQDKTPLQSAFRAAPMAGAEVLGEKLGGFEKLSKGLRNAVKGNGVADLGAAMIESSLRELPSEELTTTLQFLIDKTPEVGLNQGATFDDYKKAVKDTALATILQSSGMGVGGAILTNIVNKLDAPKGSAEALEVEDAIINTLERKYNQQAQDKLTISQGDNAADEATAAALQAQYEAENAKQEADAALAAIPEASSVDDAIKLASETIKAPIESGTGLLSQINQIAAAPEAIPAADILGDDNVSNLQNDAPTALANSTIESADNNAQGSLGNISDQPAGRNDTGRVDNTAGTLAQGSGADISTGNADAGNDAVNRPFATADNDFLPKLRTMTVDPVIIKQIDDEMSLRGLAVPATGPAETKQPETVLQNRDRSQPESIKQMRSIAANPDPSRLSFSRDAANGAPVVAGQLPASAVLGKLDHAVTANNRKLAMQYAVVEASDVVASHDVNGNPIAEYGNSDKLQAIGGNGRVAGLQEAFRNNNGANYIKGIAEDSALHGVPADAIRGMKNPVLIRVMNSADITPTIGDELNGRTNMGLSVLEQAKTDTARLKLEALDFNENGEVTQDAIKAFVMAMPENERNELMDGGRVGRKAEERLMAAVFNQAYGDDELVRIYSQAQDVESKAVITALANAAPAMARLTGAGNLDIRSIVADAAKVAVNSSREGVSLAKLAAQGDMELGEDVMAIVRFMAQNIRRPKLIGEELTKAAQFAYEAANQKTMAMFDLPNITRDDVIRKVANDYQTGPENLAEQSRGQFDGSNARSEANNRSGQENTETVETTNAGQQAQVTDNFTLSGQTNEDINAGIAAQEAAAKAARDQAKADEAARIEAERIARQEIAADSFDLTPTGKTAKETQANDAKVIDNQFSGQGDLLSAPQVEAQANQPTPELNTANSQQAIDAIKQDDTIPTADKIKLAADLRNGNVTAEDVKAIVGDTTQEDTQDQLAATNIITDFGEKLEGAKKDLWQTYKKSMSDELPSDLTQITLAKHYPEPDYDNLIASGLEIKAIAAIKAMRDEIPAKPRMPSKLRRWASELSTLREFANGIIDGKYSIEQILQMMRERQPLQRFVERIELYADLGFPAMKSAKGYNITSGWTSFDRNNNPEPGKKTAIEYPNGKREYFNDRETALAALRQKLEIAPESTEKKTKLDVYKVTTTGEIVIGKKVASNKYIDLKGGFKNAKEAFQYYADNEAQLLELLEQRKNFKPERRRTNNPRVGIDYRLGEDVTPEKFAAEFGFRGVQFGNYVEQSRRNRDLNNAYDALLDLASIINVPPRAISLNGTLGLAFGARGSGGKNAAAAHYERDQVVINLTKVNGFGSLGHEWFHALDNYFSKARGDNEYLTQKPTQKRIYQAGAGFSTDESIRPEVLTAFKNLMDGIKNSDYYTRSVQRDNTRTKDYWGTAEELAARAFEAYLIAKSKEAGKENDYLANIENEDVYEIANQAARDFGAFEDPYPYPTKAEQEKINPLFDALFSTLKTKEADDGNVILFSRNAQARTPFVAQQDEGYIPTLNKVIALFKSGNRAKQQEAGKTPVPISRTPVVLRQVIDDDGSKPFKRSDFVVGQGSTLYLKADNIHGKSIHTGRISKEVLNNLPKLLADPIAIFKSSSSSEDSKSFKVLLDANDENGDPVILAIKPNVPMQQLNNAPVNFQATIFPAKWDKVREWNENGLLRYYNEKSPRASRPENNPLGTVSESSKNTREGFEASQTSVVPSNPGEAATEVGARESFDANIGVSTSNVKVITKSDIENMPEVAFSRSDSPIFYSQLSRAIAESKQDTMPAKQWAAWLNANAGKLGVKKDELQWTGITDWLDLQQGKVSKADIQAYLDANGVQVTETMLGDKWRERVESRMEEINDEVTKLVEEFGIIPDLTGDAKVKYESLEKEFNDLDDRLRSTPEYVDETKYEKYTVEGGSNYKELLLTLPTKINDTPLMSEIKSKLSDPNISQIVRENLTAQLEHFSSKQKLESGFKSSHFVQRNILAHVRFDERTDADGNKVLFINEIQSDYGQDGKKRGFKLTDAEISSMKGYSLAVKIEELNRDWRGDRTSKAEQDKGWAEVEAEKQSKGITDADIKAAKEAIDRNVVALPRAPFVTKTDAWVSLAMKRMVRYAAENGFDKVALISGEQAADLYDLSKQVDSITAKKWSDNNYGITAKYPNGQVQVLGEFTKDKLPDVVGKELAERIINEAKDFENETVKTYSGLDLKVGGEGMRAFYNQIVPQVANDVLKKLGGGKVDSVKIASRNIVNLSKTEAKKLFKKGEPVYFTDDEGTELQVEQSDIEDNDEFFDDYDFHTYSNKDARDQLGFTITPELRAKALEGLPLFNRDNIGSISNAGVKSTDQALAEKLNRGMVRYFNDEDWSNAYEQTDMLSSYGELISATEAAFGAKLAAIRPTAERFNIFNGINYGGTNYININADVGFINIVGHEIGHDLKRDRPDLYKWYQVQLRTNLKDFDAYQEKLNKLTKDGEKKYTSEEAFDELSNDFMGDALADPVFVGELAKANPSKFKALLKYVTDFLSNIAGKLKKKDLGSSKYFNDVEAMRKHLNKVLTAYSLNKSIEEVQAMQAPEFSREKPATRINRKPSKDSGDTFLTAALEFTARNEGLFENPTSDAKTVEGIAADTDTGFIVKPYGKSQTKLDKADKAWEIFMPNATYRSAVIYEKGDQVWINVSRLQSGVNFGSNIYSLAAAYAFNNNKVFIGDPLGLTDKAFYRRAENMLSSALKYGTTKHIAPHLAQEIPAEYYASQGNPEFGKSVRPINWIAGDDVHNIKELIYTVYKGAIDNLPELKNVIFNPDTQQFETVGGELFDNDAFERVLSRYYEGTAKDSGSSTADGSTQDAAINTPKKGNPYRAGIRTAKRAALFNTFLREQSAERRTALLGAYVRELQNFGLADSLKGVFYSRSNPQSSLTPEWKAPDASKFDSVVYKLQDKNIDLKRVTQAIKDAGNEISDRWNAYLQEELYHGRTAKRTQEFLKNDLEPLITEMRMRGVAMADFEEYLWARHAEERNIQIAKINPDMPDGGSGMTTAEARDYLANLSAADKSKYEALARRIDLINAKSRQVLIDYGLESAGTIMKWEGAYKHYVPLMREDMELGFGNGTGQGFSVKGNSSKRATGSNRPVVDIIANIAQQYERNIIRGEKNRVATALIGLAKLNPNDDFWKVDTPPTIKSINKATGLVEEYTDPNYKNRDNVVVARLVNKRGEIEERSVIFNQFDERAMRMAAAIKNLDQDQIGEMLGMASGFTRYFASINTQYNPVFGVINITRDVQGALLNLSSTPLAGKQKEILANTGKAWLGIYKDLRQQRKTGNPSDTQWATLFEEFQREGGQTGYRDMYANAKDRSEALRNSLDPTWWKDSKIGKVISVNGVIAAPEQWMYDKAIKPIFDWLSDYNNSLENAVRLSVYKSALDAGHTKQQAASIAKNISVNFNRKGADARQIGALYAFFNASVQGTARIAENVLQRDNATGKLSLSKAGKVIFQGGLLLGAMQALVLAAAGYDDDEPPEFVRDRSLIIPLDPIGADGKYVTIPMPLGYNAIPATGRMITEWALSGGEDTGKRIVKWMNMLLDVTNPIGNAGFSLQTITPTVIDPFSALAENKDFTGRPIAREDISSLDQTPGFTRSRDKAWDLSVAIARGINWATGGTDAKQGVISPTADQLEYLAGQFTGGVGRETIKLGTTVDSLFTGEELPTYKIPLFGRFFGDTTGQSSQGSEFYNNLRKLNEHQAEIKLLQENDGDLDSYLQDNPEALYFKQADRVYRNISKLRKNQRVLKEQGADKADIKAIDEAITELMTNFNDAIREAKEKEPA